MSEQARIALPACQPVLLTDRMTLHDVVLYGMVWYGMVPLLPPGPQSLRPSGGSWIGRRLSMLRLSPFGPRGIVHVWSNSYTPPRFGRGR
jgi:hypothetical protein